LVKAEHNGYDVVFDYTELPRRGCALVYLKEFIKDDLDKVILKWQYLAQVVTK